MAKLYIIDASGYLYRSYFAIRGMTNAQGESTNALFGFIRSVKKLIKDFDAKNVVAVFDGPKSISKRKEIYSEYKANREETPADLRYQIGWAQEFCDLIGIPKLVVPNVEADDTMGSIAIWGKEHFSEIYLCTSDKDMCQLVNDKVFILNTFKENLVLDAKGVEDVHGVRPDQIIDYLSITGDSSDNVPGLPGFGPKTAVALLKELDTLDEILAHPEKVPGKKKQETITLEKDNALMSRELVTIDTAVEFPRKSEFFTTSSPDLSHLKKFYSKMNFNTLLKEIEKLQGPAEEENVEYVLVDDENSFRELLQHLSLQKEICFDTETTHEIPMRAELVGIGFCTEAGKGWYVPVNGKLGLELVLEGVKPLLTNPKIGFYGHNVKYDWHVMKNYDIDVKNLCFDTILASYILNTHSRRHSLDALSLDYFGKVKIPLKELIGTGAKAITMREVPIEKASEYCCEDVDYTFRLKERLAEELKERKLEKLFQKIELPLLPVLARMERNGIFLDVPCLEKMTVEILEQIQELTKEIYTFAGEEFNLNSPKQLSQILFEKMDIKPIKKTTTGYSTNAEVLETLAIEYPFVKKILEYRTLEKLRSTYLEVLPHQVHPKTHRIHPTFNQSVTATGRLSCQDPNLQNIPVRTEVGRKIREAFRPEKPQWSFLSADYSQIELRLLAHFSEDPKLLQAFQEGMDIHAHTAATVLKISESEVSKEQRSRAKAVNFGIIYGQGAFGLSRELGVPMREAADFIETYFKTYTKVKDYIEFCKEKARKSGKAVTLTGHEREIPEINSTNGQLRTAAERLAVNTPLQGTAADLIKLAMIAIDDQLDREGLLGFMVLQIHDELIFEIPDHEILTFETLVRKNMEGVLKFKVPIIVNMTLGKNWGEC